MYLGRELKKAEICLKYSKDYVEDISEERTRDLRPVLIEGKDLRDVWIKALAQVYLYGKEYYVGKYNAKTYDLPIIIHTIGKPVMHELAPRYESRDKYVKEFMYGSEKDDLGSAEE